MPVLLPTACVFFVARDRKHRLPFSRQCLSSKPIKHIFDLRRFYRRTLDRALSDQTGIIYRIFAVRKRWRNSINGQKWYNYIAFRFVVYQHAFTSWLLLFKFAISLTYVRRRVQRKGVFAGAAIRTLSIAIC